MLANRLLAVPQGTENEAFHKVVNAYMAASGGKRTLNLLAIEIDILVLLYNGVQHPMPPAISCCLLAYLSVPVGLPYLPKAKFVLVEESRSGAACAVEQHA
jgi:hypothetical protein